jgi:acyl-CoA synthetase (AMP-forming)/AMP-acid ligase II
MVEVQSMNKNPVCIWFRCHNLPYAEKINIWECCLFPTEDGRQGERMHLDMEIVHILDAFDIQVLPGYGTSECSPMISAPHTEGVVIESVGTIMPHCEVRIEQDEIWVRGDNVMLGYYKDDEANQEVFENGWQNGDLGP